jgi:hypothetical protein
VAGWGRHQYSELARVTQVYCGLCEPVSRCGLEPDWARRVFAMALKPCNRSAVVRDSKRGIKVHYLQVAIRILHVRERAR